jgi:hypothetical protein
MRLPLNSWFEDSLAVDRHNAMSAYANDVTDAITERIATFSKFGHWDRNISIAPYISI